MEELAFHDELTGLANRRSYASRFEHFRAQAERSQNRFALLVIDLDDFKRINDSHGHDAGDAVLIASAAIFSSATRAVDVICRLGGDEFAILLDDANPELAVSTVCARILALFASPVPFGALALNISVSIGAAISAPGGDTQVTMYKAADVALYRAKQQGRNTWQLTPSADS